MDINNSSGKKKNGISQAKTLLWLYGYWWVLVAVAIIIVAATIYAKCENGTYSVSLNRNDSIDSTPEEIMAIKEIGQWEFLTVSTEELAELNEQKAFGVKQLIRIYPGRLRLGIDLGKAKGGWFARKGDTAVLKLPPICLLDSNFIDEAHSRAFYESGTWGAGERRKLYLKARDAMIRRTMTDENVSVAERNARNQFENMFRSLGYKTVEISFEKQQ